MKLSDLIGELSLEVKTGTDGLQKDVTGGYVCDLLSEVLANTAKNYVWITLQTHPNIVAVASVKGLSGIIIVNGKSLQKETQQKAESEKVTIMTTPLSAFEVAGKIYQMLNRDK